MTRPLTEMCAAFFYCFSSNVDSVSRIGVSALTMDRQSPTLMLTIWQHAPNVADKSTGVNVHVISKRLFVEAARSYPNQRQAIEDLHLVLKNATFTSPDEMRRVFPSLDNFRYKEKWWVIDIGGKNLRLIAFVQFSQNRMYAKHLVTHAEYDKICKRYAKGELR